MTSATRPGLSFLIPVYREEDNVRRAIRTINRGVTIPYEILVVYDSDDDPTVRIARDLAGDDDRICLVRNRAGTGRGLLNAVRTGIAEARGDAVIVTMADLTDDISAVHRMWELFRAGHAVVCPSRYMRGGRTIDAPFLKGFLSRLGGVSLRLLTGLPTHDPTNAFKLWDAAFLRATPIESTGGFEYSLELCAKAYLAGRRIAEFPTTWRERQAGRSKFRLWHWLPRYLAWYFWLVRETWRRRLRLPAGRS